MVILQLGIVEECDESTLFKSPVSVRGSGECGTNFMKIYTMKLWGQDIKIIGTIIYYILTIKIFSSWLFILCHSSIFHSYKREIIYCFLETFTKGTYKSFFNFFINVLLLLYTVSTTGLEFTHSATERVQVLINWLNRPMLYSCSNELRVFT